MELVKKRLTSPRTKSRAEVIAPLDTLGSISLHNSKYLIGHMVSVLEAIGLLRVVCLRFVLFGLNFEGLLYPHSIRVLAT